MAPDEEVFYTFKLRTTKENAITAIRPLIDGNIRAIWNNPKWDTNLNLDAIATHVVTDNKNTGGNPFPSPLDIDVPEASLPVANGEVFRSILFDIPREPLVSIGQLQHAAAGRFSYEPSYIVGNSYANIRIPLDDWVNTNATDTYSARHGDVLNISGDFDLFDASYLVNEVLFDGYTFTTIPQDSAELSDVLSGGRLLQNPRYLPYEPEGVPFSAATLHADSAGRINAGMVLVDGAFNINSTSVDAWEVFLSGTKSLPYKKMNADGDVTGFEPVTDVRYPRVQTVLGQPWENSPTDDSWFGFRELTENEVRQLAENIVDRIQDLGPFYNLSEFINRRLSVGADGRSGILQAALDEEINASIPNSFEDGTTSSFNQISAASTQGAGFPTQVLQGDLLQALAPYMQTRSDTFKIRSMGEVIDPNTGEKVLQVLAEALVQRIPDPVPDGTTWSGSERRAELVDPSSPFGRKFRIVRFQYLENDQI
jgi:hypothetical protein